MYVMMLSEVQFDYLGQMLKPESFAASKIDLPCRALMLRGMNLLILEADTLIADAPGGRDVDITLSAVKEMLTAAKVAHKLTS